MSESTEAYVARILGYLGSRDPIEVMESTPAALAKLTQGLDPAGLQKRPAPSKWSVQEILAHLADTEIVLSFRVRRILETDGVELQAYDQDKWADLGRYINVPATESLDRLRSLRSANVRLLRSLSPTQLARAGMHAERGRESIAHISRLWAGHDLNHRSQIERIVGGPRGA
jgi:DinB superfamily